MAKNKKVTIQNITIKKPIFISNLKIWIKPFQAAF